MSFGKFAKPIPNQDQNATTPAATAVPAAPAIPTPVVSGPAPAVPVAPPAPATPSAPPAPVIPVAPAIPVTPPAPADKAAPAAPEPPKAPKTKASAPVDTDNPSTPQAPAKDETAAKKKAAELLPEFRKAIAASQGNILLPKNKHGRDIVLGERRTDPDGKTVYTELPPRPPRWLREQAYPCVRNKNGSLKACAADDEPAFVGKWLLILNDDKPVKYW